jgi:hypothetical protein
MKTFPKCVVVLCPISVSRARGKNKKEPPPHKPENPNRGSDGGIRGRKRGEGGISKGQNSVTRQHHQRVSVQGKRENAPCNTGQYVRHASSPFFANFCVHPKQVTPQGCPDARVKMLNPKGAHQTTRNSQTPRNDVVLCSQESHPSRPFSRAPKRQNEN